MALFRKKPRNEEVFRASQWRLMWWRFSAHRLALASGCFLLAAYTVVIFAEFFAPYNPNRRNARSILAPPTRPRFVDAQGKFHLRPFVYPLVEKRDPRTLLRYFEPDTSRRVPIRFFTRGAEYKLWGLVPGNIHLYGADDPDQRVLLLGADKMGRDLMSRIVFGGRISLSIGLLGIIITFGLGILIGGISGYYGGWIDMAIQRVIEIMIMLPKLPLWMGLSVALPPDWSIEKRYFGIVVILSLMTWPGLARTVRGKFMAVKAEDFVMAAELDGAGPLRIIRKYLLPSFISHIIASMSLRVPAMILGETSLSFIGLGLQAPAISWGVLLTDVMKFRILDQAPWLLCPVFFIILCVLAFNFVGDGMRDAADPYAKV